MPMANRNQKILIIVSSCCLAESVSWQDSHCQAESVSWQDSHCQARSVSWQDSRFQAEIDFKLGFFHGSRPVKSTSGETT